MSSCTHWIGSDERGRVCGAEIAGARFPFCAKHLGVAKARVVKRAAARQASAARLDAAWRARNVPHLPQMRVQLERAEAEYARRTSSPVNDRAAVGGAMHPSVQRAQAATLSDTNVARVVELERIVKRLRADIERAERTAS